MEHYISLITKAVFIENILLAYFLGMCSFLAISKKVDASIGLGLAVTFVLTITAPTNWFIYTFLIGDGALAWANLPEINLSFLKPIVFIAVIAAMVQLVEMTLLESTVFGFGSGLGWFLAIIAMASIRYRLRYSNVPLKLRGIGITMLLTGLLSIAFMSFGGIQL